MGDWIKSLMQVRVGCALSVLVCPFAQPSVSVRSVLVAIAPSLLPPLSPFLRYPCSFRFALPTNKHLAITSITFGHSPHRRFFPPRCLWI